MQINLPPKCPSSIKSYLLILTVILGCVNGQETANEMQQLNDNEDKDSSDFFGEMKLPDDNEDTNTKSSDTSDFFGEMQFDNEDSNEDTNTKSSDTSDFFGEMQFANDGNGNMNNYDYINKNEDTGKTIVSFRTRGDYAPSYGEPIIIRKDIEPVNPRKDYVVGDLLRVYVEIINQKRSNRELQGIHIREIVDDELRVVAINNDRDKEPLIIYGTPYNIDDIGRFKVEYLREGVLNSSSIKAIDIGEHKFKERAICFNETGPFYLFNWQRISENDSNERENLIRILKINFGVKWANEINNITDINKKFQNDRNVSQILISGNDIDEWALFQIDDINKSQGYLTLNISGDRSYELRFKTEEDGSKIVYDWTNILKLDLDELASKEKLIYMYYVMPKRSGVFDIESLIRISDDAYGTWPDIVHPGELEVAEPNLEFEVVPMLDKEHVYPDSLLGQLFGTDLKLKYEITFTGDTLPQYCDKITVKLDKSSNGKYYYLNEDASYDTAVFKKDFSGANKTLSIEKDIRYNEPGAYGLPGVWIEDRHYTFPDRKIIVDDPLKSGIDKIVTYNALLVMLFGLLARNELRWIWTYLKKLFHKDDSRERE